MLAFATTLLVARPVVAQEATPQTFQPEPVETTIAGGLPAPTSSSPVPPDPQPAAIPSWDFFARAGAGWEYNPRATPGGSSDSWLQSVGGGFSFQRASRRGLFTLGGSGSAVRYQTQEDLNRFTGRGNLALTRRLSPRSLFNLSSSTELANGRSSRLISDSGLLYNARVKTLSNWTAASLEQRIGDRTTLTIGGNAEIITFDDPVLQDGHQIIARAAISRQTSARTNLGVNYSHLWSTRSGFTWESDFVFGSFSTRPGQRTLVNLSAGGIRSTVTGRWRPYFVGQLGVTSRRSLFSLYASNTVSQAYGIGRERAIVMVGAMATRLLGRRASVSLRGSYSRSTDVFAEATEDTGAFNTGLASLSLNVPLTAHFGVGGMGFYQLRSGVEAQGLDIRTGGASVFMYLRKIER